MSKDKQELHKFFKNDDLIKDHSKPFDKDASKKYESFSTNITKLISEQGKAKPIIISLEATYGMGKTTLIDMWGTDLIANKDSIAIKYNAWEEDYSNEPFYSFVSSLIYQLSFFYEKKLMEKFSEKAYSLKSFLFNSLMDTPSLIKYIPEHHIAALGLFLESTIGTAKKVKENVDKSKIKKTPFDDMVKKEKDMRDAIDNFKEELKKIATQKPIYIFIDEIDRCKPTFAIELLERIKHLFNVPNVFFIVATTAHALQQNVQKFYGYESELAKEYLERFFDFQFKIPTMGFADYIGYLVDAKGDEKLKMEAWDLQSLPNYVATQDLVKEGEVIFTIPKDFLNEMIKNCEIIIEQDIRNNIGKKLKTLSFRLLNKAFNDVLVFNQLCKNVPPEMYGFVLALILSYRLSFDKKEYVNNYHDLMGFESNAIKSIILYNQIFDEKKHQILQETKASLNDDLNGYLRELFEKPSDGKEKINLAVKQTMYIKNGLEENPEYIRDYEKRVVLEFINARLVSENADSMWKFYEKLKGNVEAQIEQIASIQSDDV